MFIIVFSVLLILFCSFVIFRWSPACLILLYLFTEEPGIWIHRVYEDRNTDGQTCTSLQSQAWLCNSTNKSIHNHPHAMPIVAPNGFIHTCEWLKDDSADDGLLDAVGRTCCRKPQGGLPPRVFKPLASPLSLSLSLEVLFRADLLVFGTPRNPPELIHFLWRGSGGLEIY